MGYRQIVDNAAVLGAYVLGDYTQTTTNHDVWMLSPGIEALGRVWDFRANGYFPVTDHDWKVEGWADDFGDYSHVSFSGHNQYDAWYVYHEETGPGADAELGRKLFNCHNVLVKGFVNGYYFNMKHNEDVYGGGARVTIQPNTYLEFSLNDTYDNYAHNTFMFGLQVSLYDLFQRGSKVLDDKDLQRRLFDPIDRNFAELGSGSDLRMTGGPADEEDEAKPQTPEIKWFGHNTPEKENVWFFGGSTTTSVSDYGGLTARGTPTLTEEDGTYEDPFTGAEFNQQTLQDIYDLTKNEYSNAYLYFDGGTYSAFSPGSTPIELFPGESMWGRMGNLKGFQEPATGNNRPLFQGALILPENSGLDPIRLQNVNGNSGYGILVQDNNVTFNNVQVGTSALNTDENYEHGVEVGDGSTVDNIIFNNSTIYAHGTYDNTSPLTITAGIFINDNSRVTLGSDNTIVATANGDNQYTIALGIGEIDIAGATMGDARVNITGNNNNISATANLINGIGDQQSIASGILAQINISGNNNIINSISASNRMSFSSGIGFRQFAKNITISGENNIINTNTHSDVGESLAIGVCDDGDAIVDISGIGTTINIGNFSHQSIGIHYGGNDVTNQLLVSNTTFNILSSGTDNDGSRRAINSRYDNIDSANMARLKGNNNSFNSVSDIYEVTDNFNPFH